MTEESERSVLPHFLGHTFLIAILAVVAVWLTYHYFHGEYGKYELDKLTKELSEQRQKNETQARKLARLQADVKDLKSGLVAVEEHARTDLGLIKEGEIFVQLSQMPNVQSTEPTVNFEPDSEEVLEIMNDETPSNEVLESTTN